MALVLGDLLERADEVGECDGLCDGELEGDAHGVGVALGDPEPLGDMLVNVLTRDDREKDGEPEVESESAALEDALDEALGAPLTLPLRDADEQPLAVALDAGEREPVDEEDSVADADTLPEPRAEAVTRATVPLAHAEPERVGAEVADAVPPVAEIDAETRALLVAEGQLLALLLTRGEPLVVGEGAREGESAADAVSLREARGEGDVDREGVSVALTRADEDGAPLGDARAERDALGVRVKVPLGVGDAELERVPERVGEFDAVADFSDDDVAQRLALVVPDWEPDGVADVRAEALVDAERRGVTEPEMDCDEDAVRQPVAEPERVTLFDTGPFETVPDAEFERVTLFDMGPLETVTDWDADGEALLWPSRLDEPEGEAEADIDPASDNVELPHAEGNVDALPEADG